MTPEELNRMVGKSKYYEIEVVEVSEVPKIYHAVFRNIRYGFVWDVRVLGSRDITYFDSHISRNTKYRTYEDLARDLILTKDDMGSAIKVGNYWVVTDQEVVRKDMVCFMLHGKGRWWDVKASKAVPIGMLDRGLYIEYRLLEKRSKKREKRGG